MMEQDAKTKWCCQIKFAIGQSDSIWQGVAYTNRGTTLDGPTSCLCIGTDCMMWRYDGGLETGHCGLAGKP
jgi:hypothetical protein